MLVLSRKATQTIRIGGGISITVLEIRGGRIRLAIDAPPDVPVWRDELRSRLGFSADGDRLCAGAMDAPSDALVEDAVLS